MDIVDRKPALVGWGITDRCNLSCPHCYSSAGKVNTGELSTDACERVIISLAQLGAERIGWTGGEPLLRKDLDHLISFSLEHGIESGITTNGIPLSRRRAESLKNAGVKAIQISLDGTTAERNEQIRGASPREFQMVLDSIESARACDIPVHLAMLLGAATLDDARSFIALAQSYQVKSVRFCGFVPWGNAKDDIIRQRLDLSDHLPELKDFIEECQQIDSPMILFDPAFGPLPPNYEFHECIAGLRMLYISGNGDVYPCTSPLDHHYCVGNLHQRSIEDIWNDPAMTAIAQLPRDNLEGHCRDCSQFESCHGACRCVANAVCGSFNSPFPNCLAQVKNPLLSGRNILSS